jgi:hypothetical protein
VLKVLEQLPEGLAIAVLAASRTDLEHQLSILPASLHLFAIEAAFPSIRRHHSLTLDFKALRDRTTAYAVLHAATARTTGARPLQQVELKNIPVIHNDPLHHLISAACQSASDIRLNFQCGELQHVSGSLPFAHLEGCLSHNAALTSLQLTFEGHPGDVIDMDCLLKSLTGLQNLELSSSLC